MKTHLVLLMFFMLILIAFAIPPVHGDDDEGRGRMIYPVGKLKSVDSRLRVAVGQSAPDFTLPALGGGTVTLSQYRGRNNVVLSFVPAAWTPVCSDQWPGYNIARSVFEKNQAVVLGITVDNIPTLYAWTKEIGGLWFPVLSDFWPHGRVANTYGVLRTDGVTERALFVIDKQGIIQYVDVHDINKRPDLDALVGALEGLSKGRSYEVPHGPWHNLRNSGSLF